MKPSSKKIEIFISDQNLKASALKLLRNFSDKTISELSKKFEVNEPVYTKELLPEKFYSGVSDLCLLLSELEELRIAYVLLVNGSESSRKNIVEIRESVESMSLSDFR